MNEDAYTYVTQHTTAVLTATNAAYNAHTSTDEVYPTSSTAGNEIATSSNEVYGITQEVNPTPSSCPTDKVHDFMHYFLMHMASLVEQVKSLLPRMRHMLSLIVHMGEYEVLKRGRMKINEAYADMSSDAYTTAFLIATNAAYNAHTSTDEVYDYPTSSTAGNEITTSSNAA